MPQRSGLPLRRIHGGVVLLCLVSVRPGFALDAEIGIEQRHFFETSLLGKADDNLSLRAQFSDAYSADSGNDQWEYLVRLRADEHDTHRNGGEIQDLAWTHLADAWEWRVGLRKVFWGVTESRHLVDIINQTDLAESVDGEAKLGQPMINASWVQPWGSLDLFVLPGFRERRFPGLDGRPGAILTLDTDHSRYESSEAENRVDAAIRAKLSLDGWEIGLSHFSGTSREPEFLQTPEPDVYLPYYPVIDQTGLELQYNIDAWLLKLEAISRSGMQGGRYTASTTGFEYTQVGIFDTSADLGWIVEYNFDDRGIRGPEANERDWLLGARWSFNDADDSSLLAGITWDPVSSESVITLEAHTRLNENWGLDVEGAFFQGDDPPPGEYWVYGAENKLWPFYRDDFLQVELIRYF